LALRAGGASVVLPWGRGGLGPQRGERLGGSLGERAAEGRAAAHQTLGHADHLVGLVRHSEPRLVAKLEPALWDIR